MERTPDFESSETTAKFLATRGELNLGLEKIPTLKNLSPEARQALREAGINFITAAAVPEYLRNSHGAESGLGQQAA